MATASCPAAMPTMIFSKSVMLPPPLERGSRLSIIRQCNCITLIIVCLQHFFIIKKTRSIDRASLNDRLRAIFLLLNRGESLSQIPDNVVDVLGADRA